MNARITNLIRISNKQNGNWMFIHFTMTIGTKVLNWMFIYWLIAAIVVKNISPKQVFSKRIEAPEDADENFRFDQEYEKAKALEEFKQKNRKIINYCSNCGAEMTKYE